MTNPQYGTLTIAPYNTITIGDFILTDYPDDKDRISIHHLSGEGGVFNRNALAEVIEKFYADNF